MALNRQQLRLAAARARYIANKDKPPTRKQAKTWLKPIRDAIAEMRTGAHCQKAPGQRSSPGQIREHDRMRLLGEKVHVVSTYDEVDNLLLIIKALK